MPKAFISHTTKDRTFVEQVIIPLLQNNSIETWYSKNDIQIADEWELSIKRGLEACDWFLVVMSPHSERSEWVKDEVHWAVNNRQGRIVPILIEDCNPLSFHIRLPRIQHVDYRTNTEEAAFRLLGAFGLHEKLDKSLSSSNSSNHNRIDGLVHVRGESQSSNEDDLKQIQASAPTDIVPHQLPPPLRDFTGRTAELDELWSAIGAGGITILGLYGMGGIGKTALVLKLAEQLKP